MDDEGAGDVHDRRNDGVVGPRGAVEGDEILPATVELGGAKGLQLRRVVDGEQDGGCHDHTCTFRIHEAVSDWKLWEGRERAGQGHKQWTARNESATTALLSPVEGVAHQVRHSK